MRPLASGRDFRVRRIWGERHMGVPLSIYQAPNGIHWAHCDGNLYGPYDTRAEAEAAVQRQKDLMKLAFYASSRRSRKRTPPTT